LQMLRDYCIKHCAAWIVWFMDRCHRSQYPTHSIKIMDVTEIVFCHYTVRMYTILEKIYMLFLYTAREEEHDH
jgi:hypothetical protein